MAVVVTSYRKTNKLRDAPLSIIDGCDNHDDGFVDVPVTRYYSNGNVPDVRARTLRWVLYILSAQITGGSPHYLSSSLALKQLY